MSMSAELSTTSQGSSQSQVDLANLDLESLSADELEALIASGQLQ